MSRTVDERARWEEEEASRLQAEARLAGERHQAGRAAALSAAAEDRARRARELRSRSGDPETETSVPAVTDRLLDVAGRMLGRPISRADLSAARSEALAAEIADAAEGLLENMERQRSALDMLQRSLLPEALPLMGGVQLAAAFRPADDLVGGDWYDAFRMPGDRLAFALGDVVGHGLESAAAAVDLRNALRTHALQNPDPAFVAGRLNDLASVRELLSYSSFVYGVIDPAGLTLETVSLGHPPALLRRATGEVSEIEPAHPLLAIEPVGATFTTALHRLTRGDVLLVYTDGLIERRHGDDPERIARLAELLADDGGPEAIVGAALDELAAGPVADDIAVLCIKLAEPR